MQVPVSEQIPHDDDASKVRIPRLPFTEDARNLRMMLVHVVALAAHHRQRFERGEASFDRWVALETSGLSSDDVKASFLHFEAVNRDPATVVRNVRYWLRTPPMFVDGIAPSLGDLADRISDEQIMGMVDAWIRPPGRPRNGAVRASRWEHIANVLSCVGLVAEPASLKDDWNAWRKALSL